MPERTFYCTNCGRADAVSSAYCTACGQGRKLDPRAEAFGVAFLLNELQSDEVRKILATQQNDALSLHYRGELNWLWGRAETQPEVSPVATPVVAAKHELPPQRRAAQPQTVAVPREPRDWSWLAEQQANLFLFAGAFLTIIAAIIYVGYSGQQVGGTLKMLLLAVYTLAFLAGGVVCLRYPRVRIAGQVFFAVGAMLVPLNFVVARNILRGEDLSPTSLWLSGSIVTALFYTVVARIGVGRWYAFAGGGAIISALAALFVVADAPPEWAPALYIALAVAMSVPKLVGDAAWRDRVGSAWAIEADVLAVLAALAVALIAPFAHRDRFDVATLWFLPATFGLFIAYTAVQATARHREEAGLALLGGAVALALALPYALAVPNEFYVVAMAAVGPVLGVCGLALNRDAVRDRFPSTFPDALRATAIAATAAAAIAGILFARTTLDAGGGVLETRWFLLPVFALLLAYYIIDGFVQRQQFGLAGAALAVTGIALSIVFGIHSSPEYYAFAFIAAAGALALFARVAALPAAQRFLRDDACAYASGSAQAAVAGGITVVVVAALSAADAAATYHPQTPWFLFAAFTSSAAVITVCITMRQPVLGDADRIGPYALDLALVGAAAGIVYALDASTEYYAFAFIVPAIVLALATRMLLGSKLDAKLPANWREAAIHTGRVSTISGVGVALGAALVASQRHVAYGPDSHIFLPVAFAAAAAFFAVDAMRERRVDISIALLGVVTAVGVSIPYAAYADAPWYGVAFAASGLLLGFGGRIWTPTWVDERVRDVIAVIAVTAAWLPFEGVYGDAERIGAAVHFAAMVFYATAAFVDRSELSLNELLEARPVEPIRVAVGWLYLAALTATIGYVYTLNQLPGPDNADDLAGIPLLGLATGFALLAASSRYWRAEFRPHLYVISLLVAIFSLVVPNTSLALASILTVYVAVYLAASAWEDAPSLFGPAAMFGFLAVPAWRAAADGPSWTIVACYVGIASVLLAAAFLFSRRDRRWAGVLAFGAALYAVVAPTVGYGMLASVTHHGRVGGVAFERTALYGWSTTAMAVAGLLASASAIVERRRWVIVPSSLVLCVALLLAIGHFHPGNVQAYTVVIGTYLLLFGLLALWKFRLLPEIAEVAPYLEAVGAGLIMGPSFVQSFPGVWQYEMVVVIEAVLLFIGGVVLRRRGLLAASILFMVAVALRALFDAVNAVPNWVVVMLAGMALLGVGMGVLLGRERWSAWQEQLLAWWDEAGPRLPPSDAAVP